MNSTAPAPKEAWTATPLAQARMLLLYALTVLVALPVMLGVGPARFSLLARLVAWLGMAIAGLPTLWLLTARRARPSTVAALGLWITMCYFMAVLHEERLLLRWGMARLSEDSVVLAMLFAALVVPLLSAGWWLGGAVGLARLLPQPRLEVADRPLWMAGAGIVSVSLLADILWLRNELSTDRPIMSLIAALTPADLGFAMVLVPALRPGAGRARWVFWALFAASASVALMRGTLGPLVMPLLIYLLGWLYLRRRLRLWPVVAALLVVVLFQPVKGEFRAKVWDREVRLTLVERLQLFVELSARHWVGSDTGPVVDHEQSVKQAAARTSSALQLAHAIEMTPAVVPHQGGATYRYFRYTFLPRVLFPDKPIAQYADVWAAVMYGYTTPEGTAHVMIGLPQMAEAYINFGLLGGLLLFLGMGLLLRAADEIFAHGAAGAGALALYLFFVEQEMLSLEGSLAQFWGGVLQRFLVYTLAMALLGALTRRPLQTRPQIAV